MKHFQRTLYCQNDRSYIYYESITIQNIEYQAMFYTILYSFTARVFKEKEFMQEILCKKDMKIFTHSICSTANDRHMN